MKKVIRKNQVIITSLAILIAIAGYLNFADVDLGFGEKGLSSLPIQDIAGEYIDTNNEYMYYYSVKFVK